MKKILASSFLVGLLLVLSTLVANPLIEGFFNELAFTSNGWILEMRVISQRNLDGWSLTSNEDTAYFKLGIVLDTPYVLITPESMQSAIRINPMGDTLKFRTPIGFGGPRLVFGESQSDMIAAPKSGQSISFNGIFYYLDNSPTLGLPNDTLDARGTIKVNVRDSEGLPISHVQILYEGGALTPNSAVTDDSGNSTIQCHSSRQHLSFGGPNLVSEYRTVQVWPESTVSVSVTMQPVVSVHEERSAAIVKEYAISEPFPNPFNPTTTFEYALPRDSRVDLLVFDVNGKLVVRLYSGFQRSGRYRATWNAELFPSGVYILQLRTPNTEISKKCLLVK